MTDTEINIAIAEACGWTREDVCNPLGGQLVELWTRGNERLVTSSNLPNYTTDLNAMHEAEKVLTSNQRCTYVEWLCTITAHDWRDTLTSTARQRAEAFLRTLLKWKEEVK